MRKSDVTVGMRVTCRTEREANYSGYAGRPRQVFRPGMVGTVMAVDAPFVLKKRPGEQRSATFCSVAFIGDDGTEWRVALDYFTIRRYKDRNSSPAREEGG